MEPFFTYFGGKYLAAHNYSRPVYGTIIEPFAGAAGYATRFHGLKVVLVDKDPVIAAVWRYLIAVTPQEILALPDVREGEDVRELDLIKECKFLIGFWLNKGSASPRNIPSTWMRSGLRPDSFWSPAIRQRIARQVTRIRHWQIIEGDYSLAPDVEATWFIDPPYQVAGMAYSHSSKALDYTELAHWVQTRRGQVIVCENKGATWLPFIDLADTKTQRTHERSYSNEVVWEKNDHSLFEDT